MDPPLHPDQALFPGGHPPPAIAACDHYAGSERFMRKALALQAARDGAFDVTLDLEDGAPAGDEDAQLRRVLEALTGPDNARGRAGARIHAPDTPFWRRELQALLREAGDRLAHLTVPKVAGVADVAHVMSALVASCLACGLRRAPPVHVLIETHGALAEAHAIAAVPGVRGLDLGLMDLVSGHHGAIPATAMRSPGQFEHPLVARAKASVAAAALAHGRVPVHGVTVAVDDPDQAGRDARRAREEFGFLRMWSIHPAQIGPILDAFAPLDAELHAATDLLLAARDARWGPLRHDGHLHDRASYRHHWQVLRRARSAGRPLPDAVVRAFFDETPTDLQHGRA